MLADAHRVVEQLLAALASTPADTEHRLTGALTLSSGLFCVVVLLPDVESSDGANVPAITLCSSEIGNAIVMGKCLQRRQRVAVADCRCGLAEPSQAPGSSKESSTPRQHRSAQGRRRVMPRGPRLLRLPPVSYD